MNPSAYSDWLARLAGLPPGDPSVRELWLGFEGLDPGWALLLAGLLAVLGAWLYLREPVGPGRGVRLALIVARAVFVAGLLLFLTHPVIQLTREEPARGSLLVLLDTSASQDIADPRAGSDLARAAIAAGVLSPGPADRAVPESQSAKLAALTRRELVEAAFANSALDLGARVTAHSDVLLASFDRAAGPVRAVPAESGGLPEAIRALPKAGPSTALGDSLVAALDATAGQPLTGVLVISDGATNSGAPLAAGAEAAAKRGLPVFAWATGVTAPPDLGIVSFSGPPVAFAREEAPLQIRLRAAGLAGRETELVLREGDKELARRPVRVDADGEIELTVPVEPRTAGEITYTAEVAALPGEATAENNRANATIRVIDRRIRVLIVEQEPRWEFRYLLDTLQRDRRVEVHAVMLDGDPGLGREPGGVFLPELPDSAGLLENVIVVLGDVDPARLGAERMNALSRLVRETGGGLVFLAGPRHGPVAFRGTPLEALLPVSLAGAAPAEPYPEPVGLVLTPAGRTSPLLRLADNPADSVEIWQRFPGARWTARTGPAKPAAEVLLVDPTPAKRSGDAPQPVLALMPAGRGQVFYFGTGDTWRWRSRVGERHYLRVWGQVFLKLGLERLAGASDLVQLNTARPNYAPGDRVVVSGRIFDQSFQPLSAAAVEARVTLVPADAAPDSPPIESTLVLRARGGRPGEFEAEIRADARGRYTVVTELDAKAAVTFTVDTVDLEGRDPALRLEALEQLTRATGGRVFREEDLSELPEAVAARLPATTLTRRIEPAFNAWLLGALILVVCAEWALRRLHRLK